MTGVLGEIPEPSHIGSSASAPLHFEIMAPVRALRAARRSGQPPADAAAGRERAPRGRGRRAAAAASGGERRGAPAAAETPADAPPPAQNENWLGNYCCTTYAMLKRDSGVSAASLNARLRDFAERRMTPEQLKMATIDVGAVPLSGLLVTELNAQLLGGASGWLSITTILFGLGALVLLVACMNYANLSTARAARRAREIGLRKVLGARRGCSSSRSTCSRPACSPLAALAVAVGVVALIAPLVDNAVGIDMRAAIRHPLLAVHRRAARGVTLLGGAYPALVLSRVRPIEALRLGRVRIGPRFAATLLVGAQFAAASFLLIAVIVMYSQSAALVRTGAGSTRDQHLVINNFRPVTGVDGDLLRAELERLPQVKGITAMGSAPWSDNVNLNLFARSPEETTSLQTAFQNNVAYDFFTTLDIPVRRGTRLRPGAQRPCRRRAHRIPTAHRQPRDRPNPRAAARLSVPRGSRRPDDLLPGGLGEQAQQFRVIGVVESRPLALRGFGATSNAYTLRAGTGMQNIIVRLSADDIAGGVAAAEAVWRRLAPQAPFQRRFMDELFDENFETYARVNQVFVGLAAFAFLISVIGLFGMAIQVAGRRTHEIGVRKSVGARKMQIVRMLLLDFSKPVMIANLIAWPLGYVAAQAYLSVFIQRISVTPVPFVASLA